jgi:2-oxoglutarate ferredoxin oxidoreductase subunit beta
MRDFLNSTRPPVFCPGCTHDRVVRSLAKAFQNMGLRNDEIAIVSDIGCSGLFDTFFNTHAFHGLHGRALTYATGLKLARPELKVVVTMGDGGMGIGGAHFLSACRRNLDLTLLVMNNFNFGMTGGQFSATTPPEAQVGSGFLNRLECPLDVCQVACSAGATYVTRCSSYKKDLPEEMARAILHDGFSVLDIWGICTGRYGKRNKLTPQVIQETLSGMPPMEGTVEVNARKEYGRHSRELAGRGKAESPTKVEAFLVPPGEGRKGVIILGGAGQRIVTAGEILCYAGLVAGLKVTQKNEYNITVLRGPSISEVILSSNEIGYIGIVKPSVVVALDPEGVGRRKGLFPDLDESTLVIQARGVELPPSNARVHEIDFKGQGIKGQDWALASLGALAKLGEVIDVEMLRGALDARFKGKVLESAFDLVERVRLGSN